MAFDAGLKGMVSLRVASLAAEPQMPILGSRANGDAVLPLIFAG